MNHCSWFITIIHHYKSHSIPLLSITIHLYSPLFLSLWNHYLSLFTTINHYGSHYLWETPLHFDRRSWRWTATLKLPTTVGCGDPWRPVEMFSVPMMCHGKVLISMEFHRISMGFQWGFIGFYWGFNCISWSPKSSKSWMTMTSYWNPWLEDHLFLKICDIPSNLPAILDPSLYNGVNPVETNDRIPIRL